MGNQQTIPLAGISLALVTFVALLLLKVDPILAVSTLILWVGSLILATARPPEPQNVTVESAFTPETMGGLVENSATPIIVTEDSTIAVANRAARRMLGAHIIGQDARMAFRQPQAISLLSRNSDGTAIVRGLVRRRDIWQINRHKIDDAMAVIELINQTAEADISRAHTDFVANASHELRTPLAGIIGYVETLRESADTLDSPTSQKFLGTMHREALRMQNLVSDLMSLSRVEAEKHDAPRDLVDLWPIVERAARDAAGSERVDRLGLAPLKDAKILGDTQQLEQLIRNLVDNGFKYGSPDTPVTVELDHARDDHARLTVANRGDGIAPEHIPHLTRRFYRTDPGRSRASGGTGLGLAIVKHIVERHRGRLDIQSDLGEGTQVIVRIPLAKPDDSDEVEAAIAGENGAGADTLDTEISGEQNGNTDGEIRQNEAGSQRLS